MAGVSDFEGVYQLEKRDHKRIRLPRSGKTTGNSICRFRRRSLELLPEGFRLLRRESSDRSLDFVDAAHRGPKGSEYGGCGATQPQPSVPVFPHLS